MTRKTSLFGLRFDSDVKLNPSLEELRRFLATTVKAGSEATEGSDLARYHALLDEVQAYQRGPGSAVQDVRERMFYAVMGSTQFASAGLELAVGQYKYHRNALQSIDPRKAAAFIRSAEAELTKLDPGKKNDGDRRERLQAMLKDRRGEIDALKRRQQAVRDELEHIGRYVRDNLAGVTSLCRASIAILGALPVRQQIEKEIISGIKHRAKEQLKDSLHQGAVSRKDLETARREADVLIGRVSSLVRDDVSAVIALLTAVRDHAKEHTEAIDGLMPKLRSKDNDDPGSMDPYLKLENILVSLVSAYRFKLRAAELGGETAYGQALQESRRDLSGGIIALLEQDRRVRKDRRIQDRRRNREPHVQFTERRSVSDRRSGRNRRSDPADE